MLRTRLLTVAMILSLVRCSSTPRPALTVAVEPASGEGRSAVFTVKGRSGAEIRELRLLINTDLDGKGACYVYFLQAAKTFALVNDSGAGMNAEGTNSQCSLVRDRSAFQAVDGGLQATIAVTFQSAFAGKKLVFGYAQDSSGANTDIQKQGTWNVTEK
jgi:hypothetical protein